MNQINWHHLIQLRDLFWQLTLREIRSKYKQSILGYSWVILVPLINLVILSIVFSFIFRVPTQGIPYPIFLFVTLVPWIFMSNAITAATSSVVVNSTLITKVQLPRIILPFSAVASKLVDLLLAAIILLAFLVIYQMPLQPTVIFVPVILLVQLLLIMGVSFILSAANVYFRDVEHAVGMMLMVWMYLTPIVYSMEIIPVNFKAIFALNPLASIMEAYRQVVLYGQLPEMATFLYGFCVSLTVFIVGYYYFSRQSRNFADVI